MTSTERAHAFAEARLGIGGVLSSLDALWMNDPNRACDAMYKPRQLATAVACCLCVARTLITNDRLAVHHSARASDRGLVQKTFGSNVVTSGNRRLIHYTWRTSGYDPDRLAGVELTAHQFQDWVDKDHESPGGRHTAGECQDRRVRRGGPADPGGAPAGNLWLYAVARAPDAWWCSLPRCWLGHCLSGRPLCIRSGQCFARPVADRPRRQRPEGLRPHR